VNGGFFLDIRYLFSMTEVKLLALYIHDEQVILSPFYIIIINQMFWKFTTPTGG
jgi:hypothetical protein